MNDELNINNINSAKTFSVAKQRQEEELSRIKKEKDEGCKKENERVEREKYSLKIATKTMNYNRNSMLIAVFALIIAFLALIVSILSILK